MADEKMIDRIAALLELAKDKRTPEHEAQAAGRMAEKLMIRHAIDVTVLAARGGQVVEEEIVQARVELPSPYAKEKGFLLAAVARYIQCKTVLDTSNGWRQGAGAWLHGYESDVRRTQMLYASLVAQAMRGLLGQQARIGEDVATFRSSWLLGFTAEVAARLKVAHDEGVAEIEGNGERAALAVADRTSRVLAFVTNLYPETKPVSIRSSGSGRAAGRRAGRTADLGQPRVQEANQKSLT
ncbi:DUF2786 domain-containing protein [Saccharothrix sp. HUAS TT1]|uniref:DUF2786 domain-containing protein n=1 Tax=unclassified Saccharothrix TaxID=2593673 RepID=UPI00345B5408